MKIVFRNYHKLIILALLSTSESAWAAGGGHGSISDLFFYAINFTIFLAVTYFLARKSAAKAWRDRRNKINNLVNIAQIELEAAQEKLAKAQQEQISLEARITAMQESHDRSAAQEKSQLIANTQEQLEALAKQAEQIVAAEKLASQQEIEKELSNRVLEKAEQLLKAEFSVEQDRMYRIKLNENIKSLRAN